MNMKSTALTIAILNLAIGANVAAAAHTKLSDFEQVQQPEDPQLRTFRGTVWMNDGKFVLRDELHKMWYQLDDQRSASKFEGKEVRITGTLDETNHAIHVQDIEEDPVSHRG